VSVPVSLPVDMANRSFREIILSLVLVALATLVVMDVLLYVAVVRPVSRFAARADEISKGQMDVPELPVRGGDEISLLAAAFNRMHRSLAAAMRMLERGE
jgi:protein-histidine pros-kinase